MVQGKSALLLVGAVVAVWMVAVGPRFPGGASSAESQPQATDHDAVPNRVMTWNICNPCKSGETDLAAEIAALAPQVIGLQESCTGEVERIRNYLKSRHGLDYHVEYGTVLRSWGRCGGAPWKPGGYGEAILSAAPMTDAVAVEYPDGGSEDRGYMAVTTKVGGRQVRVFNTHLAERRQESVRAEQVDVLAKAVARHHSAIVMGDFNAVPYASELGPMWRLATDTDPKCRPSSAEGCKPTTDWQSKFDYIFLRGVDARGHHVRPSAYSDHHMLYTDLAPDKAGRAKAGSS
ncbi:endonuclease/exonuclease/phosphatase family protein [Streptomyces sp. CdTB01]|uniref:endonuclease/exonuclease/phosphatase family protein n=1 Tax=Streptomyces sp. CdTB01 TaxID=1725411 RepID=UPI00073ABD64|nr:endonuclease/exonuclease/phosphatase family protein [Streptomyces sp. CdTB01]ALV38137.1 endonuclease [Streptomyces sp. CdTB01]